jgi:16S rRNA (uracil1498-N3)-methyltransferase
MHMPRFHCPGPLAIGAVVPLPDAVAHHVQVLRLSPGDMITLFDGNGGEYAAVLTEVGRRRASAELKSFSPREAELPYAVTLAQALPEAAKMDWIVEKAVELGAVAIQPLAAQRCVTRLNAERATRKLAHWQGIVVSASEQCGRNRLARLAEPADFDTWIAMSDPHCRILLSPRGTQSLSDWARHHPPQALTLLIGPEGGFSEREEDAALARGALALSIGPRVLRTETAGMAALAALNAMWGGI